MTRSERAVSVFDQGFNCCQAVFSSFCDDLGMDRDTALKLTCGFGAGMARNGEVCGAVSGGILVIGTRCGRGERSDRSATEETYGKVRELMGRFAGMHGTYTCRMLLDGIELTTEQGQLSYLENDYFNRVCKACVRDVVELLEEIL
ncbi:MAG TPA: C-GCAxxG-C-C family protein [Deltaproteobacteria bacterium]|nr:C-GCAxxG-C-C family protein [Deltaproteobacteria bacterium]